MRYLFFAVTLILAAHSSSFAAEESSSMNATVNVKGMVCDFCAQSLKKLFTEKEEVQDAEINWETGKVELEFSKDKSLQDEEIEKIVTGNGLSVESIVRP